MLWQKNIMQLKQEEKKGYMKPGMNAGNRLMDIVERRIKVLKLLQRLMNTWVMKNKQNW